MYPLVAIGHFSEHFPLRVDVTHTEALTHVRHFLVEGKRPERWKEAEAHLVPGSELSAHITHH